jgi:hypothetical protein
MPQFNYLRDDTNGCKAIHQLTTQFAAQVSFLYFWCISEFSGLFEEEKSYISLHQ